MTRSRFRDSFDLNKAIFCGFSSSFFPSFLLFNENGHDPPRNLLSLDARQFARAAKKWLLTLSTLRENLSWCSFVIPFIPPHDFHCLLTNRPPRLSSVLAERIIRRDRDSRLRISSRFLLEVFWGVSRFCLARRWNWWSRIPRADELGISL